MGFLILVFRISYIPGEIEMNKILMSIILYLWGDLSIQSMDVLQPQCPEELHSADFRVLEQGIKLHMGTFKLSLQKNHIDLQSSKDKKYFLSRIEKVKKTMMWHCYYQHSKGWIKQDAFVLEALLETDPLRIILDEMGKIPAIVGRLKLYSYDRDQEVREDFFQLSDFILSKIDNFKRKYEKLSSMEIPIQFIICVEIFSNRKTFPQDLRERKKIYLELIKDVDALSLWIDNNGLS